MAKIRFEKSASLPTPGPIGRIVRVVPGIFLLYLFVLILSNYKGFIGSDLPRHPLLWLGIAVSFYILPEMVGIGFGRDFGRWPQLIFGLMALLAAVIDQVKYGALWGPLLGSLTYLLLAYVTAALGISLFLAGALATPG